MDIVETLIVGVIQNVLPQGSTLEKLEPLKDGRIDVAVSHGLAHLVQASGNGLVNAVFQAARPVLDGALVASCGPAALKRLATTKTGGSKKKKHMATSKAVATKRSKKVKPVERTPQGIEIIDAEFVDL